MSDISDDEIKSEEVVILDEDFLSDPKEDSDYDDIESEEESESEEEFDILSSDKKDKEEDKEEETLTAITESQQLFINNSLNAFNKAKKDKILKFDCPGLISYLGKVSDYISQNGTLVQDMKPDFFQKSEWTICSYALVTILCKTCPFKVFSSAENNKDRIELDFDDNTLINVAVQLLSKSYHMKEMRSPGLIKHFPHLLKASANLTTDDINYTRILKEISTFKKKYMV